MVRRTKQGGLLPEKGGITDSRSDVSNNSPPNHENITDNDDIAVVLNDAANVLESHGANPFRVRAYRRGAETLRILNRSVHEILREEGIRGLEELPGIGRGLAHSIEQVARMGRLPLLERMQGEDRAERLLATVPNIGPTMARRIHEMIGVEDLLDLQVAAGDGRLARVPGMGEKRLRAVRETLAGRIAGGRRRRTRNAGVARSHRPAPASEQVPVSEILDVDEEYRRLARQNRLPKIAPTRFNPTREAWLPVLRTGRGERRYTAMFSNTAHAHELGTTRDWVIVHCDHRADAGPWTVITSRFGSLRGRRIVRGREEECAEYYAATGSRYLFRDLYLDP